MDFQSKCSITGASTSKMAGTQANESAPGIQQLSSVKHHNFLRTYSRNQGSQPKQGYPDGYTHAKKRLPQVSPLSRSKNDMYAPSRSFPGKPNNFWGNEAAAIALMEGVCQNFDDWEDLINFRRCCSTFASIGIQELRKRFGCRITKRFALYFWLTFKDYPPDEIPYRKYQLSPKWLINSPIDMNMKETDSRDTDEVMQNILRMIGHHLTLLRLEEFRITGGISTVRNLLFQYAPNMTELVFIEPEFSRNQKFIDEMNLYGGPLFHRDVGDYIPKLRCLPEASTPLLSRPGLIRFEYHAKSNTWLPLQWTEVFLGFPNLRELSVRNLSTLEMSEVMAALTSNTLGSILPLQKINMFYTSTPSSNPENEEMYLVTRLLPLYQQLPFKLTDLSLNLKLCFNVNQMQEIIIRFSESLQSLTLTREPGMSDFPFCTLFDNLLFPQLKVFQCTNDILNSLSFLNAMPALNELKMWETDSEEKYASTTLFSRLFQRTDFETLGEINLKVLHLPKCLDFPKIVDAQDLRRDLKFGTTFHDLRTLYIGSIDNGGLRAIFGQLATLRELKIFGSHLCITDEGIIGFDGIQKIQRFVAKAKEVEKLNTSNVLNFPNADSLELAIGRDFPYVGDLLFLRSFVIESDSCNIKVSKLSLDHGFKDCELLNCLELYGTQVTDEDVKRWKRPPSIVSVSVNKEWEKKYLGIIPECERV